MAVTLDGIDIETIIDISERQVSKLSSIVLGIHSLELRQHMKSALHQYDITAIWSAGSTDYTNKKRKLQNIADGGLPVWLNATDWATNQEIFGRVEEPTFHLSEGMVDVYEVRFLVTAVFPWGYTFIQADGAGDFRIYDLDKHVQSRTINPLLRRCNWTRTATQFTYSIYVKNIGGSSGVVVIEIMVPDGLTTANITTSVTTTKAAADLGTAGISVTPGSKRRITLTRTLAAGVEEQWDITITYTSSKTSFIDGSIDDTAA